jgi:hypothetical protein
MRSFGYCDFFIWTLYKKFALVEGCNIENGFNYFRKYKTLAKIKVSAKTCEELISFKYFHKNVPFDLLSCDNCCLFLIFAKVSVKIITVLVSDSYANAKKKNFISTLIFLGCLDFETLQKNYKGGWKRLDIFFVSENLKENNFFSFILPSFFNMSFKKNCSTC